MSMGDRIKRLRIANNLTMEELATKLGLKKAAISKYENGIVENIPRSTIAKMAEILGTTPAFLMGWDEEDDTESLIEMLKESPETRMLFDAAKGATAEQIKQAAEILKVLKGQQ